MANHFETTLQMSGDTAHNLFYNKLGSQIAQWKKIWSAPDSGSILRLEDRIDRAKAFQIILGAKADVVVFTMSDYVWLQQAIENKLSDE